MDDRTFQLNAHRQVAYVEIGERGWPCLMFFHGAPASRLRIAYLEPEFLRVGVRVISPDRPGYGRSSRVPARTVSDWAADANALADHLNVNQYMVAGHSTGGAYALACTALSPERVQGAILLGAVTDMRWPPAWDGYLESEARLMRLPTEESVVAECEAMFGADGSQFFLASGIELSPPDERLYADERIATLLATARAEAFRQGVGGYAQDVFLQGRSWTFDPGSIRAPVLVAHGDSDSILSVEHSRYTASMIPGAELRVLEDHGHLSILSELPRLATRLLGTEA